MASDPHLPDGNPDPDLIVWNSDAADPIPGFIDAIAKHRHFERETDPPMV